MNLEVQEKLLRFLLYHSLMSNTRIALVFWSLIWKIQTTLSPTPQMENRYL